MLYRKDDLFGRVLLFSAMRKMILQLRYHAVYPVVKMIALHCAYVRAAGIDGRYTARASVTMKNKTRWGMAFFMRHFKCCSEKLGAVLF